MKAEEIKFPKVPERPNPKLFRLFPETLILCSRCKKRPGTDGYAVPKRFFKNHMETVHGMVKRG